MASVFGKWKLKKEGSDYLPGSDKLHGVPLVMKLTGNSDAEFFKITKRKQGEVEEISVSYVTKNGTLSATYQLGVLNYEQVQSSDVCLASVQNCDLGMSEFSLLRVGPKCGQNSRETFRVNRKGIELKLYLDITAADGVHFTMIKYFERIQDGVDPHYVQFSEHIRTLGWKLHDFWPSTVLGETHVLVAKCVSVSEHKVCNDEWVNEKFSDQGLLAASSVSRRLTQLATKGDDVMAYVIKVQFGPQVWFVVHRYREFDAVNKFLMLQNPHSAPVKTCDDKFPAKTFGLTFRSGAVEQRARGLEEYLIAVIENARFLRQNSVDAMCSFLEIPENLTADLEYIQGEDGSEDNETPYSLTPAPYNPAAAAAARKTTTAGSSSSSSSNTGGGSSGSTNSVLRKESVRSASGAIAPIGAKAKPINDATVSNIKAAAPTTTTTATSSSSSSNATFPTTSVGKTAFGGQAPPSGSGGGGAPLAAPGTTTAASVTATVGHRQSLHAMLGKGLLVIKHGRQGAPKKRMIRCDPAVSRIFWGDKGSDSSNDSVAKSIVVADVIAVRTGLEIDPELSPGGTGEADDTASVSDAGSMAGSTALGMQRRPSRRASLFRRGSSKYNLDQGEVLYGTETLRRNCKPAEMALSLSLILKDRTFDIQFLNEEDFNLFLSNIKAITNL